jgi:hypothetical protein
MVRAAVDLINDNDAGGAIGLTGANASQQLLIARNTVKKRAIALRMVLVI